MQERRAHEGDWFGIFGSRVTLLVPPDARDRAARTWPLVDDDADVVTVLQELVSDGLDDLCDFVLVQADEAGVRLFVRGAAEVTAHSHDGRVRLRAGERLWQEDSFVELVALEVTLPPPTASPGRTSGRADVEVRPGVGRVGQVTWGTVPVPLEAERPVVVTPPAPPAPPVTLPPVVAEPAHPPALPEPPETAPFAATPPLPSWQDEVTTHLPPAPAPEEPEESGLAALGFGDEPVAVLAFAHGEEVPVDRPVLVGRGPTHRPGSPDAALVTVPSPHQEVSGTHVEFRPGDGLDLGSAVVTDLGSTNGTVVVQPGLPPRDLRPGEPVALRPGALVDLGDGAVVEVHRP